MTSMPVRVCGPGRQNGCPESKSLQGQGCEGKAMRWPLALLLALLCGVLLLPFAFPVAADSGKEGRDADAGKGDKGGGNRDHDDDGVEDDGDDGDDEDDDRDADGDRHGKAGKGKKHRDGRGHHAHAVQGPGGQEAPRNDGFPGNDGFPRNDIRVSQDYDVAPGLLTFTFRVTNHGQATAKDVHLSGALPDVGTWLLTDATHCRLADEGVACSFADLAPGAAVEVQARSVLVGDVPPFTNVVQVYTPAPSADAPSSP